MRFSRSDTLAVASILATILFGILTILPQDIGWRITLGVLTAFSSGVTLLLFWLPFRPPWTVLRNEVRVVLQASGSATIRKTVVLRNNHINPQEHYVHRNISADGSIQFTCDSGVIVGTPTMSAGDYSVGVRFRTPVRFGHHVTTWLEMQCNNCFPAQLENFIVLVDNPIRQMSVDIEFPSGRPPQDPRGLYHYSGSSEALEIEIQHLRLLFQVDGFMGRSIRYGDYELSWHW